MRISERVLIIIAIKHPFFHLQYSSFIALSIVANPKIVKIKPQRSSYIPTILMMKEILGKRLYSFCDQGDTLSQQGIIQSPQIKDFNNRIIDRKEGEFLEKKTCIAQECRVCSIFEKSLTFR